ncbi:MAG: hypothetical protein HY717_14100 [Planctomycetes bacterium]|nr:hypothetical protein [Planctomycetota bacterium]
MDEPLNSFNDSASRQDDGRLAEIIADYLDRLNRGEKLDPVAILAEYPESGPRIIAAMEEFVGLDVSADRNSQLCTGPL